MFFTQAVCPFCREPGNLADDDDIALAYYAKLDILLKAMRHSRALSL
jgi:hypothetical protein